MSKLTPMMQQYLDIHNEVKDAILFFRLGDFYEMFFDDAILASKELEIALTGRNCGLKERAPMCGVPYHSAQNYIAKLVEKGYKVAICEQVEEASETKGIVRREITRIISPGTVIDENMLEDSKNNYLLCIYLEDQGFGIAITDVSTGEFMVSKMENDFSIDALIDEVGKFNPSEIIANNRLYKERYICNLIENKFNTQINPYPSKYFHLGNAELKLKEHFNVHSLNAIDLEDNVMMVKTAGALIQYLEETQKNALSHINHILRYDINEYMLLDLTTRRNLELTETIRGKDKTGSLLWILDKTITSLGGRLIRQWVERPLLNKNDIKNRLDSVEEILINIQLKEEIKELLKDVYDIQRLITRISYGTANARDLLALKQSIKILPALKKVLEDCNTGLLRQIFTDLDPLEDVFEMIDQGITEEPPLTIKEGNIIKYGFDEKIDKYRDATKLGKDWIANLQHKEREKTGIKNLKIGFNKVFGYYLDVTKSNIHLVPDYFIRKQTLSNSERYLTPELKELESIILESQEKLGHLEYEIFQKIRGKIIDEIIRIQSVAKNIAVLDVLWSFAFVAYENNYIKPEIINSGNLYIEQGRHPVVENMMGHGEFISNDCILDGEENRTMIITGPNMAGKSTYMRQVALVVLMAQIGCFVPADTARISVSDRIFTRVGASDDLSSGQSTFMVEMSEVSNILKNATSKSLVILDEIGRGTSTFDGLSIAWAVIEYISNLDTIGSKTLFATHYHELTILEEQLEGVKNYSIAVKEKDDDIIFLREIMPGRADQSYGIEVAKLAGLPNKVIERSKEILEKLEAKEMGNRLDIQEFKTESTKDQVIKAKKQKERTIFNYKNEEIIEEIKNLSLDKMTPIELMTHVYTLQQKLQKK